MPAESGSRACGQASLPSDQSLPWSLPLWGTGRTDAAVSLGRPKAEQAQETDFSLLPTSPAKHTVSAKLQGPDACLGGGPTPDLRKGTKGQGAHSKVNETSASENLRAQTVDVSYGRKSRWIFGEVLE